MPLPGKWAVALALAATLGTSARADIETLVERNPFGEEPAPPPAPPPRTAPATPAPQLAAQYEWIGFFESAGTPRFGFRDRSSNRSFWIREGATENGLTVVGFNLARREVQVRQGTTYGVIGFKEANYASGPPPPQRVPGTPGNATQTTPTPPGITQNTQQEPRPNVVRRRIIVPRRNAPPNSNAD